MYTHNISWNRWVKTCQKARRKVSEKFSHLFHENSDTVTALLVYSLTNIGILRPKYVYVSIRIVVVCTIQTTLTFHFAAATAVGTKSSEGSSPKNTSPGRARALKVELEPWQASNFYSIKVPNFWTLLKKSSPSLDWAWALLKMSSQSPPKKARAEPEPSLGPITNGGYQT